MDDNKKEFSDNPNEPQKIMENIENFNDLEREEESITTKKNNEDVKDNKKIIIFSSIIAVIVLLFLFRACGEVGKSKDHSNTTGLSNYKDSDVDMNCVRKSDEDSSAATYYADFLFNHKNADKDSDKLNNYQLYIYNKIFVDYKKNLSDEEYREFIKSLNSLGCINDNDCKEDHLELGVTDLGSDTVIDRKDNKLEITFIVVHEQNKKASKNDIEKMKKNYEAQGYECH